LTSQRRKRLRQANDLLTKRKLRKSFLAGHRFGLETALDLQRHWVGQGLHFTLPEAVAPNCLYLCKAGLPLAPLV
jgi:hypothetical protein